MTGVPVHLSSFWPGHSPSGLYNDCKESEANGPHEGNQASAILGGLADRSKSQEEAQVNIQSRGRPNPVLGVNNKSGEIRT